MEEETLEAIVETLNSRHDDTPYSFKEENLFGNYITKDTTNRKEYISFGKRAIKLVLEEHGVIPIKTMCVPDYQEIRIWFEELDTKEVTREIYTIE